jgi:hypothetical protein
MIFQVCTIYNRYNLTLNLGMHFTPYIIQENENLIYDVNFFLHLYEWDKSNDLIV